MSVHKNNGMKKLKFLLVICLVSAQVYAQYPSIPPDVQRSSDSLMRAAMKHSDAAWALALPIIREEAKKGKPYVDFASRPTDLPQSTLLAFPGAEGGGMYSFGGRGGRVIVVTNLEDDGPGSFRWACEQGGARIIVFQEIQTALDHAGTNTLGIRRIGSGDSVTRGGKISLMHMFFSQLAIIMGDALAHGLTGNLLVFQSIGNRLLPITFGLID